MLLLYLKPLIYMSKHHVHDGVELVLHFSLLGSVLGLRTALFVKLDFKCKNLFLIRTHVFNSDFCVQLDDSTNNQRQDFLSKHLGMAVLQKTAK